MTSTAVPPADSRRLPAIASPPASPQPATPIRVCRPPPPTTTLSLPAMPTERRRLPRRQAHPRRPHPQATPVVTSSTRSSTSGLADSRQPSLSITRVPLHGPTGPSAGTSPTARPSRIFGTARQPKAAPTSPSRISAITAASQAAAAITALASPAIGTTPRTPRQHRSPSTEPPASNPKRGS